MMEARTRIALVVSIASFASLTSFACGSTPEESGAAFGGGTGDGVGGAPPMGGAPGTGGAMLGTGGGVGGGVNLDGGGVGGGFTGDAACAATSLAPETIETTTTMDVTEVKPIALYLMVDQSGSMAGAKWTQAVNAIIGFVNDPASANLDVALNFFATADIFRTCDISAYGTPLVPLGRLPGHAPAIINETNLHFPSTGTPISAALAGATGFCEGFKTLTTRDPADEDCVVVFLTDGDPSGCDTDLNNIAQIAGDAWTNSQVRTYAIGMQGANFGLLNDIATRGNGDCDASAPNAQACDVTTGAGALSAALALIRDTITTTQTTTVTMTTPLACEWGIPAPPPGEIFDPTQVNVELLANGTSSPLGNVASQADCPNFSNAWYYDDPINPTRIIACDDTCTAVTQPGVAGVNVLLGCAIEPAIPK